MYLIWSNQQRAWWRAGRVGYTQYIEEAGRYTQEQAREIVADSTCGGLLERRRVDPYTGRAYVSFDEVYVLAPEDLPA